MDYSLSDSSLSNDLHSARNRLFSSEDGFPGLVGGCTDRSFHTFLWLLPGAILQTLTRPSSWFWLFAIFTLSG